MSAIVESEPQVPKAEKGTPVLFHRKRGLVIVLLCVMYFISYFDRTNIATAGLQIQLPTSQGGLGLSPVEFGLATSVFAIGYAVFQVFGHSGTAPLEIRRAGRLSSGLIVPTGDQFQQLWPIRANQLAWPPPGGHLDTTSLQALARF